MDLMQLLLRCCCSAVVVIGACLVVGSSVPAEEKPAAKTKRAWTLDEALAELRLQPRDPYLQYVVLQLARRQHNQDEVVRLVGLQPARLENRQDEVAKMIDKLLGNQPDP